MTQLYYNNSERLAHAKFNFKLKFQFIMHSSIMQNYY